MNNEVTVLGVGNTLLRDDGIGVRIAEAVQKLNDPLLSAIDGGTMGFRLADLVKDAWGCILVDAAELGAEAGTVEILKVDDLTGRFAGGKRNSAHDSGLVDLIGLVRLEDGLPDRLAVVAVQPADTGWGETLTDPVDAAIPVALDAIRRLAESWRADAASGVLADA